MQRKSRVPSGTASPSTPSGGAIELSMRVSSRCPVSALVTNRRSNTRKKNLGGRVPELNVRGNSAEASVHGNNGDESHGSHQAFAFQRPAGRGGRGQIRRVQVFRSAEGRPGQGGDKVGSGSGPQVEIRLGGRRVARSRSIGVNGSRYSGGIGISTTGERSYRWAETG